MSSVYSIEYSAATGADASTKTSTVRWTILNFFTKLKEHKSRLRTKKDDCKEVADEDTKFLFKMEFFGMNTDLFGIYFLAPVPMFLKYVIRNRVEVVARKEYFMVQPNKWQFMIELLTKNIRATNYISAGNFFLSFNFTINKEIKVDHSPSLSFVPKVELNRDLENIFDNSIYSDVIIKSVEGVEFQTHKVVLAARSAVLKAHFDHNTVESLTNVIETSLETEVLKEVLRYIYTDNTPKVDEMPEKLLAAADYYQFSRLKQLCEVALFQKLTVENAIATLEIADLHSATNLKKITLEFIRNDGRAGLITKTQGWSDLQSGALIKTMFEYVNGQMDADLSQ